MKPPTAHDEKAKAPASSNNTPNLAKTNGKTTHRETPGQQPTAPTSSTDTSQQSNSHSQYQQSGPGFENQVTGHSSGWNYSGVNGSNPALGHQHASAHQTPGFVTQARAPAFFSHPPPSSTHPPFYYPPASITAPPAMAADYSNGVMPNMGQHFQPPVPDTSYGGMIHTWHPRFDGAPAPQFVAAGNLQAFGAPPLQYQQVQTGLATAPTMMPMMVGAQQQPIYIPAGQPAQIFHPGQVVNSQPAIYASSAPGQMFVGTASVPPQHPPDIMGIGKTGLEAWYEQCYNSQLETNKMSEPQDFKPADPDPGRMYPCREVDGAWTQRNLVTIERLEDARWYIDSHGRFYAVRSAD